MIYFYTSFFNSLSTITLFFNVNKIYFYLFYRGESNFHVFYYLYDGLESEGRWRKFYLDEQLKSRHRYLQPLSVVHRDHNLHRWRQLNQAFKVF